QPNKIFSDLTAAVRVKFANDVSNTARAIAGSPHAGSRLVQAMSFIRIEIVDENFVWHLLNHKPILSGHRIIRILHFLLQAEINYTGSSFLQKAKSKGNQNRLILQYSQPNSTSNNAFVNAIEQILSEKFGFPSGTCNKYG